MSETVAIPRAALWALVGGLAVTSLTAAFLLGRQTAGEAAPTVAAGAAPADDAAPRPPRASEVAPAHSSPADGEATATAARSSSAPPAATAATAAGSEPAAVSAYLAEMDAAVARGQTGMTPDAMAQAILLDAMAGRTDGFDRLIALNRAVLDQVRVIAPPRSCADCVTHRGRTAALLKRSLALLSTLRDATAQGDLRALAGAQDQAAALEAEARELEALEQQIAAAHGLTPAP